MEEDKNYINMIHGDLARASQVQSGMPENVGVMNIKTANRTILEASQKPTPRSLWDCFWYEGELSCLFADSNVGKSILAVQIADRIAQTDNVLYLDFELSEKQFQLRYTNEHGNLYSFPERLYRVSLDCDSLLDANFEEAIIGSIEQMALQTGCRIFIVDNLIYLCCAMEKGDAAGRLMIQLNNLKKKYGLSLLVLAHTPKRSLDCPITSNDLAGSKRLYNFFDSVFAIGKSAQDGSLRYVKQLKVRYGTYSYDGDNVIIYEIEKVDCFLQFVHRGYSTEKEHLKQLGDDESTRRDSQILELSRMGKSLREIASQVGCGKSTVGRVIHRSKENEKAIVPSVPPSQPLGNGRWDRTGHPIIPRERRPRHETIFITKLQRYSHTAYLSKLWRQAFLCLLCGRGEYTSASVSRKMQLRKQLRVSLHSQAILSGSSRMPYL